MIEVTAIGHAETGKTTLVGGFLWAAYRCVGFNFGDYIKRELDDDLGHHDSYPRWKYRKKSEEIRETHGNDCSTWLARDDFYVNQKRHRGLYIDGIRNMEDLTAFMNGRAAFEEYGAAYQSVIGEKHSVFEQYVGPILIGLTVDVDEGYERGKQAKKAKDMPDSPEAYRQEREAESLSENPSGVSVDALLERVDPDNIIDTTRLTKRAVIGYVDDIMVRSGATKQPRHNHHVPLFFEKLGI